MTIEKMKEIKQSLGLTNHDIAEISGIPYSTVQKVFSGITRAPRKETILTLEKSLALPDLLDHPYIQNMIAEMEAAEYNYYPDDTPDGPRNDNAGRRADDTDSMAGKVAETLPEYHAKPKVRRQRLDINHLDRQGHYTIRDLSRLPDNIRAELIDGEIIIMEAPSTTHQKVLINMLSQFYSCTEKHAECELLAAPVDVQLDCDNKTMVQPDILITCDKSKDRIKNIYGAPDLVIEICSPSTRKKDMVDKLHKYENAGVREYWIVDPMEETVDKYVFSEILEIKHYTFDDKVTVTISDGECEIDFNEVKAHMN